MSSLKKNQNKKDDKKIIVNNDEEFKLNEIKILRRTLENNTHEVIEDIKLKCITSWRKSKSKFLKSLLINILTLGITHIISLYYPNLYIKLYCNPWPAKECDFFLVENIYGKYTLCTKIHKKNKKKSSLNSISDISKREMLSSSININKKMDYYFKKNLTYSFIYKSMTYEYNEITNEINPVYLDLSKMTNKEICISFSEGLMSENIVKILKERYGKNEYFMNVNLLYLYYKKVEVPSLIIVLIIGAFEFFLKDYISFVIKYVVVLGIFFFDYLITKKLTANIYCKDYTLDGDIDYIKVRRKYLIQNSDKMYAKIKKEDLLPGDIIFLKTKDKVPCDCLILEGECIANESNLTGSLEIFKKVPLESNNKKFNYEHSKVNILLHGMEIVSSLSKSNNEYISALCLNTGPNTFKANQYSNILDLDDRKKEYKEIYDYLGNGRKYHFISAICIYISCLFFGFMYILIFKLKFDSSNLFYFIFSILMRTFCKSFMPMYIITNTIIIISSIFRLKKEKIFCFDKSRLLNCGDINTIFFSKTGTLCNNIFEITSYHPVYINPHRPSVIKVKNYTKNQSKEINYQLEKYYQEYFYHKQNNYNNYNNNFNFSQRHSIKMENNKSFSYKIKNDTSEYSILFIECLLSCNNLEKLGNKIFGNIIETTLFNDMRWDLKPYNSEEDKQMENSINYKTDSDLYKNLNDKKNYLVRQFNIIHKKRSDIFPKNYFKITESLLKNEKEVKFQENSSTLDSNHILDTKKYNNNDLIETENNSKLLNNSINENNPILNDISKSYINSYIIRIYKRFICNGSFNSSSIIYNFMTKELRFMIKGIPEFILDKCDWNTLPDNFDEIISFYRKNGLIIIICATKLLNLEEYSDLNDIDYYMNDLTFCGFITLKNKLKDETKSAINDLKKFDCNLIITSGDNVNNSLSIAFESEIIENKNVFVLDKDEEENKITIRKIYSVKREEKEESFEDDITNSSSIGRVSKINSKNNLNKVTYSPLLPTIKYKYSYIRSSQTKKIHIKKNESINVNQTKESNDLIEPQTPTINFKNYYNNKNKNFENKNTRNYLKSSKILFDKNNLNFHKNIERDKNIKQPLLYSNNIEMNKNDEKDIKNNARLSTVNQTNIFDNYAKTRNKKTKDLKNESTAKLSSYNNDIRNKYLNYFQKFYYYPNIFKDNEELKDNCILCISGKLFSFLYNNKDIIEYKYLLEKVHKYCKIFFQMTSLDKSRSIDFFREYKNSCVCIIGECQSDFDQIMSSNAGINIRAPKNFNTILCHFHTADSSILCIKKIILEGRFNYENIFLLRISSIFCTMIINSYILTCFIRHIDVIIGQLNLLEIIFLSLSIAAFTGKPDNIIDPDPLVKCKNLFIIHYIFQIIGLLLIKLLSIFLASRFYRTNRLLDPYKIDNIFCTYYFILCIELIFSTSLNINYISFYKKNIFSNTLFMIFVILILIYFLMLITLNSSNIRIDIFDVSYFEYFEYIIDSFDDRNRLEFFAICIFDFLFSFILSRIIYIIFDKLAKNKLFPQ